MLVQPVPVEVARYLSTSELRAKWTDRYDRQAEDDSRKELWWTASTWLNVLDCGHLVAGPHVYFWRTGEIVHAWCDNRYRKIDGHRAWATYVIYEAMPAEEFELAVREFLDGVLAAMQVRVDFIESTDWKPDGVHVDVEQLRREQANNARHSVTGRRQAPTVWSSVAAALKVTLNC